MTTEHQRVALGDACNRRKAWIAAELECCQLEAQHETGVAARAAKVERQRAR
jgi:hypothetical protein